MEYGLSMEYIWTNKLRIIRNESFGNLAFVAESSNQNRRDLSAKIELMRVCTLYIRDLESF